MFDKSFLILQAKHRHYSEIKNDLEKCIENLKKLLAENESNPNKMKISVEGLELNELLDSGVNFYLLKKL